jgi:hypothetical protein
MASEDWGTQMLLALKAVRTMHADSSRLLLDLDRALVGYKSIYGSFATMDLSYDIKRASFMSEGLLRHWVHSSRPDTVIAVNIAFWDDNAGLNEPFFIAAKLLYADALQTTPDRNKAWDPWYAYLNWTNQRKLNEIVEAKPPEKRADILRAVSIGVPLSSIVTEAHGAMILEKAKSYDFS